MGGWISTYLRPFRMSRLLNNPWASRVRHSSPSGDGKASAAMMSMSVVPEDGRGGNHAASGLSTFEVRETPQRYLVFRDIPVCSACRWYCYCCLRFTLLLVLMLMLLLSIPLESIAGNVFSVVVGTAVVVIIIIYNLHTITRIIVLGVLL